MIYCVDIDGVLCNTTSSLGYEDHEPYYDRIAKVNKLYDEGSIIKLFTARGSNSGIDWKDFTIKQLSNWGVKYHELRFGKPSADFFVDDKMIPLEIFFA